MKKLLAAVLSIFMLMGALPLRVEAAGLEETGTDTPVSGPSSQDTSGGDTGAASGADPSAADGTVQNGDPAPADPAAEQVNTAGDAVTGTEIAADAGPQANAAGDSAAQAAPDSTEIGNEIQAVPAEPEAALMESDTVNIEAADTVAMQSMPAAAPKMQALGAAATYTVTVATDNINLGNKASGGGLFNNGDKTTVTATAAAGYEFVNWTDNGISLSTSSSYELTVTKNITLTANFKQQTFTFPIESVVGGTYSATKPAVNYGGSVDLTAAANPGYHFDADWMRSDNSGESYSKLHGVSSSFSNITTATRIYPVFIENQYNVTFNANHGAGGQMKEQQFAYSEEKALSANTYTRDGYSFAGWNTLPSPTAQNPGVHYGNGEAVSKLAADDNQLVTLYAQWQLENYTITCNLAGGSFPAGTKIPSSYTIQSGPISIPDPIRSNYTFRGWTSKDFDGVKNNLTVNNRVVDR